MKKFVVFVVILLLLHLPVLNPTDDALLTFQFLAQGSHLDAYSGEKMLIPYNLLFNIAMSVLFISRIFSRLSEIFNLRAYVITRGGSTTFKWVLIKKALWESAKILLAKLLIYALYFIMEQRGTWFILYDLVSTFLTLSMFSFVFILCKLNGANNKIPLFMLTAGNMIAQIFSFEFGVFSVIVIASIYWQNSPFVVIAVKILILLLLTFLVFFKKNVDQMLEVKNQ